MNIVRQILSFGAIGICATLTHVGVAWSAMEFTALNSFVGNFLGAASAYLVSFLGNARFTFGVSDHLGVYAIRYLGVSLQSLALTSAELAMTTKLGLSNEVYALIVLITVPPTTFALARFWAFAPTPGKLSSGRTPGVQFHRKEAD